MSRFVPRIDQPPPSQIAALKQGCPRAADQLLRACEPRISALAARYVCPGCRLDELAQEGRIAVWRAAAHYDPEQGSFEPFVTKAVKNAFLDLRRANPMVDQELNEVEQVVFPPASLDFLMLSAARQCLTREQADVVHLLYEFGMTQRQAGRRLALCQARVAQLHQAAISRLRGALQVAA